MLSKSARVQPKMRVSQHGADGGRAWRPMRASRGDRGPEGVGDGEAVEAVEDAGQGLGLAPEGGAEGVDGAVLGDEDLLLVEALPLALVRLFRAGGQRHTLAAHVPAKANINCDENLK